MKRATRELHASQLELFHGLLGTRARLSPQVRARATCTYLGLRREIVKFGGSDAVSKLSSSQAEKQIA